MNSISTNETDLETVPQGDSINGQSVAPCSDLKQLTDNVFDTWSEFCLHLSNRKKPRNLHQVFGEKKSALGWGVSGDPCRDSIAGGFRRACQLLDGRRQVKKKDAAWLAFAIRDEADGNNPLDSAYQALALASLLPEIASVCQPEPWCEAVSRLVEMAGNGMAGHHTLARQIISVELPLTLACLFPEMPACSRLAETAFDVLLVEQEELLDTDGAILSKWSPRIPAFMATWTRSLLLAKRLDHRLDHQSQEKWEWFVRYAMRLLRRDGTSMLGDRMLGWNPDLYQAAVKTSTDKDDRAIARLVLPGGNSEKKKPTVLVDNGCFSAWAGLSVLQTDWSPKSARIPIAIHDQDFQLEACRGVELFGIKGLPDVSINGKTLEPVSDWEDVCWHSDSDLDYLELEIDLAGGVRLQRQICLVRADEALFFADAILGNTTERIDYRLNIELAESLSAMQETENTEFYLKDRKIRSLLLPLGMSEWKSARTDDRFERVAEHSIAMSRSVLAKNLYTGLFVDLCPGRSVKPRTWRNLTIGESLEIVPPDVATAFRVRIGDQQWVMYRSLEKAANRTFLGQNHSCEFFIGRFQENGNVEELLSVEA